MSKFPIVSPKNLRKPEIRYLTLEQMKEFLIHWKKPKINDTN